MSSTPSIKISFSFIELKLLLLKEIVIMLFLIMDIAKT